MNYAKITYPDLNNGEGCRVTLWLSGCSHHCKGCFNSELHDFNYGKEFDLKAYKTLHDILELPYIKGVTLSGGDPLQQKDIIPLCRKIKKDFPHKDIWVYTGYYIEETKKCAIDLDLLWRYIDVLVDGPFDITKKDITIPFRGSSNQSIYRKSCNCNGNYCICTIDAKGKTYYKFEYNENQI